MQAFPPNSPALRAQLEAQVNFLTQWSRHSLDALGQLSALNVQAARQLIDDSIELGRALAACKDPFQMVSVTMRFTQPAAEHGRNWQSGVMRVLAAGGAALAHDTNDGSWQAARGAAGAIDRGTIDRGTIDRGTIDRGTTDRAEKFGAAHNAS